MPKIDLNPLQSGGSVDPVDNPTGAIWSFVMLVIGFAVFFAALAFGREGSSVLQHQIGNLLGIDTSEQPQMTFTN